MKRLANNALLMLIAGLVLAVAVNAEKQSQIEMSEFGRSFDDDNNDVSVKQTSDQSGELEIPVNDQISVLSRQLKMLTERRQEDYRMLERSLHSFVQKHFEEHINSDIKKELKDLR